MNDMEALRFTLNVCIWLLAGMAMIWVVGMMAMLPWGKTGEDGARRAETPGSESRGTQKAEADLD